MDSKAQEGSILSIVSGKEVITKFAGWSQNEFGVSLNASAIAIGMKAKEIPDELKNVVVAIEKTRHLMNIVNSDK